ncbi:MAG: ribosome maturation factor RimM [Bacteroidota bacterium]
MHKEDCFELGYITKTHGLKGELSFYLDVDYPDAYQDLEAVLIGTPQGLIPFEIEKVNLLPNKKKVALVKLQEINHIDEAAELVGATLYLPLDTLPALEGNSFYFHEVINYQVLDEQAQLIGTVQNVYDFEANSLLSVAHPTSEQEILIPISDESILKVDRAQQQLVVRLPDGLLEIYLKNTPTDEN